MRHLAPDSFKQTQSFFKKGVFYPEKIMRLLIKLAVETFNSRILY